MSNNIKYLLLALFGLTLFSCGNEPAEKPVTPRQPLEILMGTWKGKDNPGEFYEQWHQIDNYSYKGSGGTVVKGDTTFSESITINYKLDEVTYNVTLDENRGPIVFKLTDFTADKLVFENPEHDFPQKIAYNFTDRNNLLIRISGKGKGEKDAVHSFILERMGE